MEQKFLPRYTPHILGYIQKRDRGVLVALRKAVEEAGFKFEYCTLILEMEVCSHLNDESKDSDLGKRIAYWNENLGLVHTYAHAQQCKTEKWLDKIGEKEQHALEKVYEILPEKEFTHFKSIIQAAWESMRINEYLYGINEDGSMTRPLLSSNKAHFFESFVDDNEEWE